MRSLVAAVRQLWSLFVDDGSLACTLVIWRGGAGFVLPRLIPFGDWNAPILFVGCVAILFANIMLTAWGHGLRGQKRSKTESEGRY